MRRIMALDVGDRRTGVALSDPLGITAQGLCVIEAGGPSSLVRQVAEIAGRHEAGVIVVGLPLNMDGSAGERARKVLDIIEMLKAETGLEVTPWDERLTTMEAERVLIGLDVRRGRRKRVVDMASATLILQGYLERQRAQARH
ncbi:MAG: Holliday junction resolvase RuvX [Ignavibacteriales bacterium]